MADDGERWTGQRIGAYELVALIGSGGLGEVYRARRIDAQYEKEVAIKLVPATHSAGFILQRVRAERQMQQYNDAGDYKRAIELCRAGQPLLAKLRTDEKNAQIELDGAALLLHLGGALLGLGRLGESAALFEQNVNALRTMAQQRDSLQIQYLLAGSEEMLGRIETRHAVNPELSRDERLRRWRRAKQWYEDAVPRFQNVASRLSLTPEDMVPIDNAVAGLAKSKAEIAKLQFAGAPAEVEAKN